MPTTQKLRCSALSPAIHVALLEPEIPPNTGAVARTCAALGSPLHLVGKLGFSIDERSVRRAGLDYWHLLELHTHPSWQSFAEGFGPGRLHFFSTRATRSYLEADLRPQDCLVFGKESVGLDPDLLDEHSDRVWGIPTSGQVRSLNLSNAVSIVLYEAMRRNGVLQQTFVEPGG